MTLQQRSTAVVTLSAIGLVLIRQFESNTRHTFGNAHAVDWLILGMFFFLGFTHVFISAVMWIQRGQWLPSEAKMFRFISIKSLLWFNFAAGFTFSGRGVLLDIAYLYILIAVTTLDMDLGMFRRYVLGKEVDMLWDGIRERRRLKPGRRKTDAVVDAESA
jgi:hypothetical protein